MCHNGKPSDDLRDHPKCPEVLGAIYFRRLSLSTFSLIFASAVAYYLGIEPVCYFLFNAHEDTADEKDILGIDGDHFLLGMFPSSLGRDIHY